MAERFQRRDDIRRNFAWDLLLGRGIEIGAGNAPHRLPPGAECVHYDLRDAEGLATLFGDGHTVRPRPMSAVEADFPAGADFLIAHNVLEHSPNPIGTLIGWNNFVRSGGVVVISLPHFRYCPDSRRRLPPFEHILEDFLAGSNGSDFASREHTASFTLGWHRDYCASLSIATVYDFSRALLDGLHSSEHDVHWHALDTTLSLQIVAAAAHLGGTQIEHLRQRTPERGETVGDILIAYRVIDRQVPAVAVQALIAADARRRSALATVGSEINRLVPPSPAGPRLVPLERPFHREGTHCFLARIPPEFLDSVSRDALTLEEDGRALGPGDTLHDAIRRQGGGAFSFWGDWLYFSSSDQSDCNSNGRDYVVVGHAPEVLPAAPKDGSSVGWGFRPSGSRAR